MYLHDINYNFELNRVCRSVGQATAAFVLAVLEGNTKPGVWFPEEVYILFIQTFYNFPGCKLLTEI